MAAALVLGVASAGTAQTQTQTERYFEHWSVLCVDGPEADKRCALKQLRQQGNPPRMVFQWVIGDDGQGRLVNLLQTPIAVNLRRGIRISVEGDDAVQQTYEFCGRDWCQARFPFSNDLAERLSGGESLAVRFFDRSGRPVDTEISPAGFREALAYLEAERR